MMTLKLEFLSIFAALPKFRKRKNRALFAHFLDNFSYLRSENSFYRVCLNFSLYFILEMFLVPAAHFKILVQLCKIRAKLEHLLLTLCLCAAAQNFKWPWLQELLSVWSSFFWCNWQRMDNTHNTLQIRFEMDLKTYFCSSDIILWSQ